MDPISDPPRPAQKHSHWRLWLLLVLLLTVLPVCVFAGWAWITLHYSYSTGERAGYVQKISKKGWLCKTWEGELAITAFPGTAPQIFSFSVRDDAVAEQIQRAAGQRVALTYEQHKGVPSSCFGETQYFIRSVRTIGP
ncbi:MAG: hypothetical protein JO182_25275 [Acidobacteriaceae bacterium]|nr:hypothetical protein [Acidobacteriaceae bacterium]MBV9037826.1 hypothetical protein [Acidobacteriaceae bacterium]MBV9225451.1 hypothetical protein [Acidobacteriaceae bacterium]MBV9308389.1 hypothetical protein [Acidobacteriaceae bacterium]